MFVLLMWKMSSFWETLSTVAGIPWMLYTYGVDIKSNLIYSEAFIPCQEELACLKCLKLGGREVSAQYRLVSACSMDI
jgi:hypothetical protein